MFCAPLSYLYRKHETQYYVFRAMYVKYWCKLQILSSRPGSILYLSCMFESLLESTLPEVFYHCVKLGVQPLTIAFPWLFSAFVGCVTVSEVLLLWDRIVGFDSLLLLPVLACSFFSFRAKTVLNASSADELHSVFAEIASLELIPLLQLYLFGEPPSKNV
jgi:hypothetical protein